MADFMVYEKCELKKELSEVEILRALKKHLCKYYNEEKIIISPSGLKVKGNLKDLWERAVTEAAVKIKIDGDQVSYQVDGKVSLGSWPWVWFALGLITGVFLVWFFIDLIEYLICRDRPKKYFEEAFRAIQFEFGQ